MSSIAGMSQQDFAALGEQLTAFVPFVRTLGLEYEHISPERAVVVLPDRPEVHNHLAGPHAGAIFSTGETASGAIVLAAFGDQLDRLTPVAVRSEITYLKRALGTLRAEATATTPAAELLAALAGGARPEFPVEVSFRDEAGTETGRMQIVWALLRAR
jgi:acyl-coenzyme A thioesterase PaaI-like protein